jgi:hypothetical protein
MTAVDILGFWFPVTGVLVLGLGWFLVRDTLRLPPGGGEGGGSGGGSDRAPQPRSPWSWHRRSGRPAPSARRRSRASLRR